MKETNPLSEDLGKNPTKAIDAILDSDFQADGLTIHPLTLGRYALLELIESPFIFADKKFTLTEVIPSAYVMTQPISALAGYSSDSVLELRQKALAWADAGDFKHFDQVIDLIVKRIKVANDASPQGTTAEEGTEKKTQE